VKFTVLGTSRYTVTVNYTFRKNVNFGAGEEKSAKDTIIIDIENKSLIPKILIQQTSDYVPTLITVDGSQSRSENGEIKKFTYNFGEGRPVATGDAIQSYEYTTPGEKEITLTITNSAGQEASTKKVVVLKESPRTITFTSSMSPGVIGAPVDFVVGDANGQIDEYIWNFGDNTTSSR
jgi:PKD repeat protein